jgi:hypothetical protein
LDSADHFARWWTLKQLVALKRFGFDVKHLNRFSSCFDAHFGSKTVSHFSDSALVRKFPIVHFLYQTPHGPEIVRKLRLINACEAD